MKKLCAIALLIILPACAAGMTALTCASQALPVIDSFYNNVLAAKMQPQSQKAATIILQQADELVKQLQTNAVTEDTATAQAQVLKRQAAKLGIMSL